MIKFNGLPPIIERYVMNGSSDRVNSLLSVAILLSYEINMVLSEAEEILDFNGLKHGSLKKEFDDYQKAVDVLFNDIMSLTHDYHSSDKVLKDVDKLDGFIKEHFGLVSYNLWKEKVLMIKDRIYYEKKSKGNN